MITLSRTWEIGKTCGSVPVVFLNAVLEGKMPYLRKQKEESYLGAVFHNMEFLKGS